MRLDKEDVSKGDAKISLGERNRSISRLRVDGDRKGKVHGWVRWVE